MLHQRISSIVVAITLTFVVGVTSTHAITISPVRAELRGDPGAVVGGDITIINDQSETKTYYASYENFEAQGDSGVPKFIGKEEGLATWISTSEAITIAPGDSKVVPYTITIPKGATPGGYFGAVFWSTTPPASTGGSQVSIGAKVGMLVLLTVNGDIAESAGLKQLRLKGNDHFYTARPVSFEYSFVNTGGDRVQPKGTVVVRSILGWVSGRPDANPGLGNVLPNTERTFRAVWDSSSADVRGSGFFDQVRYEWHHFALGIYRAKVQVSYGSQELSTKSNAVYFVVVPWHLLVTFLVPLIFVWFGIRKATTGFKARIIRQLRQEQGKH